MKNIIKHVYLLALMLLCSFGGKAQEANILKLTDIRGNMAGKVSLPISIENTCNDIVAFQFRLHVPQGVTIDTQSAQFTSRTESHSAIIQPNANGYVIMAFSPDNKPIVGNSGKVMTIDLNVGTNFEPDDTCDLVMSQVLISDRQGNNVLTNHFDSKLIIGEVTDFIVTDIDVSGNSYIPGKSIPISWVVKNQGGQSSTGGWSEQVSLISSDGRLQLLGTVYYDGTLGANSSISRQADFIIPALPGIEGNAKIEVKVKPNADSGELPGHQSNNTTVGTKEITLEKALLLVVPSKVEESNLRLRCQLGRSGNWSEAQTFNISIQGDNRIICPTTIKIPQGQSSAYFYLNMTDDNIINEDSIFMVKAEGNGYASTTSRIVIEDNEHPSLGISTSKSEVTEGETFQLTVTASRPSSHPIIVTLGCEDSKLFSFPSQIIIPAGELSTTFDITSIEDDDINTTSSVAFKVSAAGYDDSNEIIVLLADNDMPKLQLILTPASVSEGGGTNAIIGKVKRIGNLNSKVTIMLSDDSNGLLKYSTTTLTMKKGESEATFSASLVNDLLVNGDRQVNVTAAVYMSSCDCYSTDQTEGHISQVITVFDDDGPTLLVAPSASVFLEGSDNNSLTITRNAGVDKALTVTITSDYDEVLVYEHKATIAAGQTEVKVPVSVKSNDMQDDDKAFTFTVSAQGFTQGTCWAMVSDQSLPDAQITDIQVSSAEAEAESSVNVTVTVKNTGNSLLRKGTPVDIYLSGENTPFSAATEHILRPGEEETIEVTYALPAKTGDFTIQAVVNANKRITELLYSNNYSTEVTLELTPCLSATLLVDKKIYQQGEAISIWGTASGSKSANAKIEIYFINDGNRLTTNTTTDGEGRFSTTWTPPKGVMGYFQIGACYPGENLTNTMAEVDVYGLKQTTYRAQCQFGEGDTYTGSISITNPGRLPMTGLKAELMETSSNAEFTFSEIGEIAAGKTVKLTYSIKGNGLTRGSWWQTMPIAITTNEGSRNDFTLYYFIQSQKALLAVSKTNIVTTMTMGKSRDYPITIRNIGKGETGIITLSLPKWITTATPRQIASLAQGDSTLIMLRFNPTDDMYLNMPVTGYFGINCENGSGKSVSFSVTPVSEEQGRLVVDVVDEFTYHTNEAPHVSNANVKVKDMSTGKIVAQGTTNDDGCFTADMSEGWYSLTVNAENHISQTRDILVGPGEESREEVFISYDAITYEWNVEETTVDDKYSIETIVKFETRVPKPCVVVSIPDALPDVGTIFPVSVTNIGFINASDVQVSLNTKGDYELEFLNDPYFGTLAPQQTAVLYAKFKLKGASNSSRKAIIPILIKCVEVEGGAYYTYYCGPNAINEEVTIFKQFGKCPKSYSHDSGGGGSSSGYISGPSIGRDDNIGNSYHKPKPDKPTSICQEKDNLENGEDEKEEPVEVPNDDPEETDDCEKGITLDYCIVPFNGKRIPVERILADGSTPYMIDLDPRSSLLPSADCEITEVAWHLSEAYGVLTNYNSLDNIVYVPPVLGPEEESSKSIEAVLTYKKDGELQPSVRVPILLEKAEFKFKLVEVDEDGNVKSPDTEWKGVAADGVSRLKIVLKSPSEGTTAEELGITNIHWQLPGSAKNYGEFDNVNSLEPIFTAPIDFPLDISTPSFINRATVTFDWKNIPQHYCVDIDVRRVPLVLLHGLGSNSSCWNAFVNYIVSRGLYDGYQIDNTGYEESNTSYFTLNQNKPQIKIKKLIDTYRDYDILATKADIAGHSMGGILARLHVQYNYAFKEKNNVHKLITVNTPHSGSEWGDAISSIIPDVFLGAYLGAIDNLGVNSDAINKYLNGETFADPNIVLNKMNGIPIHAISTHVLGVDQWTLDVILQIIKYLCSGSNVLSAIIEAADLMGIDIADRASKALGDVLNYSDLVVSVESQQGGLDIEPIANHIHMGSTEDSEVRDQMVRLLVASVDAGCFSHNGFHPHKRTYSSNSRIAKTPQSIAASQQRSSFLKAIQTGNKIDVNIECDENIQKSAILIVANDSFCQVFKGREASFSIPEKYYGRIMVYGYCREADDVLSDSKEITILSPSLKPLSISSLNEEYNWYVGEVTEAQVLCLWEDGSETVVNTDNISSNKGIIELKGKELFAVKAGKETVTMEFQGLTCTCPITVYGDDEDDSDDDSNSVCSTVSLKIEQRAVMTRQAFRGTLTVNNGHPTKAITDFKLNIEVRDEDGILATSHEFQINPESLSSFDGELKFDAGWSLGGKESGTATILFIPTKYAAPTEAREWSFGGSFSYTDPYTGLTVTRNLNPVTLTVNPSPVLDFTYFMQRDVLGDDPLTPDVVEPKVPAEFALLINNRGYGDVERMEMTTHQPEITENEKGLLIDFEIISSQLNGQDKSMSLGGSMVSSFGQIPALSQTYAQWWLQSSLLGHFTEYDVKATHVTSYDNPDLSLLGDVAIHELTHGFTPSDWVSDGSNIGRGFLVNDIPDNDDLPDAVYFTDATHQEVTIAQDATIIQRNETKYALTMKPSQEGWTYGSLYDPTNGRAKLTAIIRESDGASIPLDNVWQTDRTLLDGKDPLYEFRLHFVADLSRGDETYILTFLPLPTVGLVVESVMGISDEKTVLTSSIKDLTIRFNKDIDTSTFTEDDIMMTCQGEKFYGGILGIEKINSRTFKVNFHSDMMGNGYYTMTIQTATITDAEGFTGTEGKLVSWVQYVDNHIVMNDFTLSVGETKEITIRLENAISHYNGFQFSLYLPEGVTIVSDNQENGHSNVFDLEITRQDNHYDIQGHLSKATTNVYNPFISLLVTASDQITTGEEQVVIDDAVFNIGNDEHGFTPLTIDGSTGVCKLQIDAYISSLGYATFSWPRDLDFEGLGIETFICTRTENGYIHLEPISKVPAYTGIILKGNEGYYHPSTTDAMTDDVSLNLLTGTAEGIFTVPGDNVYVLSNKKDGIVGFYQAAKGLEIKQYRAFLRSDSNAKALFFDITDGIWNVETQNMDNSTYDLMGRKVNDLPSLHKGVYIINGKKVVIK